MRTRLWLAVIAICVVTSAEATKPKHTPETPDDPLAATSTSASTSNAQADSSSNAEASAQGGAGGSATSANSLTVEDRRQAPSTFTGAATPTAPCYYVDGFNASIPGAGGGRFKSKLDEDCVLRERARLLIDAGRPDLAVLLLYPEAPEPVPTVNSLPSPSPSCEARTERVLAECVMSK